MPLFYFVSDLHGSQERFEKLFKQIRIEKPDAVFLGGDLMPSGLFAFTSNLMEPELFVQEFLTYELSRLKKELATNYPEIYMIMGNDDAKIYEPLFIDLDKKGLLHYIHNKKVRHTDYDIYGYAYVPPSPFMLKDWEKYDVSRYVDPGCVPPEEGSFSVSVDKKNLAYETIQKDLDSLVGDAEVSQSIFLFHTPPYKTKLDRAALDGKFYDHVPLDVHVGSIAVERFIKDRQPLITLHGHIHESTSITGEWKDHLGSTICMNAAHNGPELALIRFHPDETEKATRTLI